MVSKIETNLAQLNPGISTPKPISGPLSSPQGPNRKSIGDVAPTIVNPADYPHLEQLLSFYGVVSGIFRKLKTLTKRNNKKDKVVLAKNTVGAADNKGNIFLGVEFLEEYQNNSAVLAGVLAHEWGHLLSNTAKYGNLDNLSWDEIFGIRKEEECAADAFCGRILPLMGYSVEPIIEFLMSKKDQHKDSHKYYSPEGRAEIIRQAAKATLERQKISKEMFKKGIYTNPYNSILLGA